MPRLAVISSCLLFATTATAEPPIDSRGYLTLNGSSTLDHSEVSFGLGSLEWGRHPTAMVDNVVSATLVGAVGLRLGPVPLELGASMPFTVTSGVVDRQGLGDAGFHAKLHLGQFGRAGIAAIGSVFAPTSDGEHGTSPQALAIVDLDLGRIRLGLSGGVRRRMQMGFSDTVAPVGAAAAWALAPGRFEVIGEMARTFGDQQRLEILAGVKLYLAKNSYLSLGAGRGFTDGATPDARALIGIVFEPKAAARGRFRVPVDPDPDPRDRIADRDQGCVSGSDCPDADADLSAIVDNDDGCRGDFTNCKRDRAIVTTTEIVTLDGIEFEFDRATIRPISYPTLDAVAKALDANPDVQIVEIRGHTDERGSDAYNLDLSDRRAAAVLAYLTAHGVAADRLTSTGYGKTLPIDLRHVEAAWIKNRRVEFQIRKRKGVLQ